jgi:hypothetical protein
VEYEREKMTSINDLINLSPTKAPLKALSDKLALKDPNYNPEYEQTMRIGNLLEMSAKDPDPKQYGISTKRVAATAGNTAIINLLANMKTPEQKNALLILAQLAEAGALHYVHEPFRVVVGASQF